jgi:hypothetical protein
MIVLRDLRDVNAGMKIGAGRASTGPFSTRHEMRGRLCNLAAAIT